jgi:hypothetical protein
LFCHVTSRVEGDAYQTLLQEKGGRGFPYLVWMDAEGNVLAKQGDRSVEGFDKTRKTLQAFLPLEAKAAKGDKEAGVDALIAGIELGRYDADQAKERLGKLGTIPADKQKAIDGLLVNLEVDGMMAEVGSPLQAVEVGRKFLAMEQAGRVPTGRAARTFYALILEVHAADKDAPAYEAKLEIMTKLLEGDRNAARLLKRFADTLEKLKQSDG